jgi:hypothetical protein
MRDVVDRVPANPNRYLVTPEGGGAPFNAVITRADNPTKKGTPVGRALFMALQGMEPSLTEFEVDGSITETFDTGVLTTTFPDANTIVETFVGAEGGTVTKTTTFNPDGSISEVIS